LEHWNGKVMKDFSKVINSFLHTVVVQARQRVPVN
jgi:hypothetical protein